VLLTQKIIKKLWIIGKNNIRLVAVLSEYTHNDDVAELLYQNERDLNSIIFAKDQEIEVLKKALDYCNAELDRLEKEHARGF